MPENDILQAMTRRNKEQELIRVAHGRKEAWAFCLKVGIDSVRNLEIYLKKTGVFDGHEWSHQDIADEYGISRPRSVQICCRTRTLLRKYYASL